MTEGVGDRRKEGGKEAVWMAEKGAKQSILGGKVDYLGA